MSPRDKDEVEPRATYEGVVDTLDHNGVHLVVTSPEGIILWASQSLVETRGRELVGGACHESLFRRSSDQIPCQREEVLATGRPHRCWIPERRAGRFGPRQMLVQMRTPDGNLLEALIEAGPADRLFYDQIFRERVLSEGLRHVPSGVLLLDPVMRIVSANPPASALLGADEDELRGRPLDAVLPEGALPECGAALADFLSTHEGLEETEVTLGRGAARRVFHLSLAPVMGPDEELAAAVAILTDLTHERLVGEALTRKLGELTLLQEVSDVLARTVRLDHVLRVLLSAMVHPRGLGLSQAALFLCESRNDDETAGLLRGRLARRKPEISTLEDSGVPLSVDLERMAREEGEAWERGMAGALRRFVIPLSLGAHPLIQATRAAAPFRLELGRERDVIEPLLAPMFGPVPAVIAPLTNQGKRLGVLVGIAGPAEPLLDGDGLALAGLVADRAAGAIERARLHDELAERHTELREAHARMRYLQGQLLRAEKLSAIGELAAEIMHQIRNPLAVVGGFTRRLARAMPEDDPRGDDLRIIVEETERMETILERIRQDVRLARLPAKEVVRPEEVVSAAVARYRAVAREQGVSLQAEVEEGLPRVRSSRDILLEVLDNLMRNAFDAIDGDGRVCVSAKRLRDAVHIVVEDDGPGLTAEQREKVFEPFYTTKLRGTGLGLPLSKRLIAHSGGSLIVDSRPGEGARFRIVMPLAQQGQEE